MKGRVGAPIDARHLEKSSPLGKSTMVRRGQQLPRELLIGLGFGHTLFAICPLHFLKRSKWLKNGRGWERALGALGIFKLFNVF